MSAFALGPFAEHVGEGFAVVGVAGMTWTLTAADGFGAVADPATHDAFSLLFRGPAEPVIAQQTVTLAHSTLGEQAIFVTPIAGDADGVTYQAVFN